MMTFAVAIPTTSVITTARSANRGPERTGFFGWHGHCSRGLQRGADESHQFKPKDTAMQNAITNTPCKAAALFLGSTLGLLMGCGESHMFSIDPGHIDPSSISGEAACLDGAQIELVRYSTRCERATSKSLVTEVGDGMEFSAEQVSTLESPCPESPNPGVEIHLEHASLIFDFSNVARPDQFPRADFDGYVIDIVLQEDNGLLFAATVDSEESTIELQNVDVSFDPERIEVNFEGLSYDDRGFVKINLWFAPAEAH
jgi:hypothetical protein